MHRASRRRAVEMSDVSEGNPAYGLAFQVSSGGGGRCAEPVCWISFRREGLSWMTLFTTQLLKLFSRREVGGGDVMLLLLLWESVGNSGFALRFARSRCYARTRRVVPIERN